LGRLDAGRPPLMILSRGCCGEPADARGKRVAVIAVMRRVLDETLI
jgi:hypothetical protein